jgi:hypothetical protein
MQAISVAESMLMQVAWRLTFERGGRLRLSREDRAEGAPTKLAPTHLEV